MWAPEVLVRLAAFAGILAALLVWERARPRRRAAFPVRPRRFANLAVVGLDTLVLRLAWPAGAVGVAWLAAQHGLGLLPALGVPALPAALMSVVALDLTVYLQHRLFHAVPALWRVHRVHHADLDVDATTGVRFHPVEVLVSLGIKAVAIVLLGAPPVGVLAFEVLLNATSLFNHANVALPLRLDRVLRGVLVTPDMHRVHHSVDPDEMQRNFGFSLAWWDRLLGTYRAQPARGHAGMGLGLPEYREPRAHELRWLLALPFASRRARPAAVATH